MCMILNVSIQIDPAFGQVKTRAEGTGYAMIAVKPATCLHKLLVTHFFIIVVLTYLCTVLSPNFLKTDFIPSGTKFGGISQLWQEKVNLRM